MLIMPEQLVQRVQMDTMLDDDAYTRSAIGRRVVTATGG